jgi:hypothetical protein
MPTSSSRHPIVHDNILNHLNERDYFGFTANSVITSHYALVMGAGNAKAFKDRFPNLDVLLAVEIDNDRFFHFATTKYQNYHIFALQTKVHWKDRTPIKLLKDSLRHLELFAAQNKHLKFHLPTPGIGYGGLSCKQVYPLLDALHLDNLILYEI